MSMSVDGFITGQTMGVEGSRLFNWMDRRNDSGPTCASAPRKPARRPGTAT